MRGSTRRRPATSDASSSNGPSSVWISCNRSTSTSRPGAPPSTGLLFILLTFAVVLLWEVRHALSLHPLQYLMVGCALVVFYLLLLSLSEHLGFAWAYGLATAATVGLVTAYAARILASGLRGGGVMAGWLGTLYGFLYTLLQLEDLALLLGSIAVFLMLAALMYFTRRIDWYTMRTSQDVRA